MTTDKNKKRPTEEAAKWSITFKKIRQFEEGSG